MDCEEEWLLGDVDDSISGGTSLPNPILFEDRMISDSVEYEHSYSNANGAQQNKTTVTAPIGIIIKTEKDLDDECYPAVPLLSATGQGVFVKSEAVVPPPVLPFPAQAVSPIPIPPPPYTAHALQNVTPGIVSGRILCCTTTTSSNVQDSKVSKNRLLATALSTPPLASLLRQATTSTQSLPVAVTQVKVELPLPPTPPSSTSSSNESESDGCASPLHPGTTNVIAGQQLVNALKRRVAVTTESTTHGVLALTEEEKRTLIAEGYPVPQKLPLTKAEERSLKKIRRKIKNKISAQESRRKKKEYMDALERRVEQLSADSRDMRRLCDSLEEANKILRQQLHLLQQRSVEGAAIIVETIGICEDNGTGATDQEALIEGEEMLCEPMGDIVAEEEIINIGEDVG
ncbi:cyclic AMP-responsive element-binding protein 3-like protein 2 isoform X2 [Varroa jacobsoni]|uniref:BZIP domain-containing protein n=1 Tax=Varroa destructor TaxID=109461 RepID=A0A7M7J8H5_VARDE|nr:cyclic AMP-responsive element-binding protein 3-like protein 2 isoform X2 [Varroa destructor]XP_022701112.1 cyclic AMP-responsive element-binding protein 3-like protein 2 isoform X2 [Varroa jacobsoni]